ncbi:MAG: hypothetical protein K2X82_32815 [Gemmataceae bacterium]|nr:hypothetical protein [Gemmataceae bacterium]
MPSLELFVGPPLWPAIPQFNVVPQVGGLGRVPLRRLYCDLRCPPHPGARQAVLDTGAPLTILPHAVWSGAFNWRAGRDYDELPVAVANLHGHVAGRRYTFILARLRVPVELAGRDPRGDRLRLDDLVCQLADPAGPPLTLLGLWGGAFVGRKLAAEADPAGDDLAARLDW